MNFLPTLFQIAIPLAFGILAASYLREVTRALLLDLCGTPERADFWVRTTAILLAGTPLALVLVFGHNANPLPEVIHQAMTLSLIGTLLAVAFLARLIWKQVPADNCPPSAGNA